MTRSQPPAADRDLTSPAASKLVPPGTTDARSAGYRRRTFAAGGAKLPARLVHFVTRGASLAERSPAGVGRKPHSLS